MFMFLCECFSPLLMFMIGAMNVGNLEDLGFWFLFFFLIGTAKFKNFFCLLF